MMLEDVLSKCDFRYKKLEGENCENCSYSNFCPHDCKKCLDYIHYPNHKPKEAPKRKYDCIRMADVYTCKYACRYTSEIMYALEGCKDLYDVEDLKILSFGCGPCTDLFAVDCLHEQGVLFYNRLEYRGIDYSKDVWKYIHKDIANFQSDKCKISFYYKNACDFIYTIAGAKWTPNLIVFQYVFSDMQKNMDATSITEFINVFAEYYNNKVYPGTYIILNDINLGCRYGGGRDYFDRLLRKLEGSEYRKGRFCNDNSKSPSYPRGYTYGKDSVGEFPCNKNRFDLTPWSKYSPFDTCASAQMLIKKVIKNDN